MEIINKTKKELLNEIEELTKQLQEANDTIDAIRTGQIDALVVQNNNGPQLYTLKSVDQTYRLFIEKMTEGAVMLNRQGIIVYCNTKFASMVDCKLSKILGAAFSNFILAESKEAYQGLFEKAWRKDAKGELFLKKDDIAMPVQLSLTSLELDEGVSLNIILTDLTAQKLAQKQLRIYNDELEKANHALEESNHDLQQFASVASHDLQEPLRKIQIFSQLLREEFGEMFNGKSEKYLERIIDSARRMKTLIIDILNYSKLSSNTDHFGMIDLNLIVNDVLEDFDLIIQEKSAKIMVGELPAIRLNHGQIRQVFQNIISNALKFVHPARMPEIVINAKRIEEKSFDSPASANGQFYLISIRDNGIGLDEQYVENIFTLFERLHPKDKYEGTGIGLAIAKKIIEKHNGLIHVKSKEAVGSEFMIILPATQHIV